MVADLGVLFKFFAQSFAATNLFIRRDSAKSTGRRATLKVCRVIAVAICRVALVNEVSKRKIDSVSGSPQSRSFPV